MNQIITDELADDIFPENYKISFRKKLRIWYEKNKRDLPWRNTGDPYYIWLSEIILQQTRVVQGLNYYLRFIHRFPDVRSLAEAKEDEVLKYWQGLGYYSRARNLHTAARMIMKDFDGRFPVEYQDVLSLRGVGEYTAAAICSSAYNAPHAVVDGNVFRFLSRLFGITEPIDSTSGKKIFTKIATFLLDPLLPSIHNQAMMEMGAIQCTPSSPDCTVCPFLSECYAYKEEKIGVLPVKQGKTKVSARYFYYFFATQGDYVYLSKRTGNDVWKNLYEFPLYESTDRMDEELFLSSSFDEYFKAADISAPVYKIKHVLSHRIIHAAFYEIEIPSDIDFNKYMKIKKQELVKYPVSRLIHLFLENRHPYLLNEQE